LEIVEEKDFVELVLEMPGISEKDLTIETEGKTLYIEAENDLSKYKREVALDFEPKKKIKARENHGIITITIKK
jgi:HSP20 family protein